MLTNMRLQNFKSWKDSGDIRLAPLTGFFGTNSSGKTSLLQMLLLLKQTAESSDRSLVLRTSREKDGIVDLGTLQDIIHNNADFLELSVSYDRAFSLSTPSHYENMIFTTNVEKNARLAFFSYTNASLRAGMSLTPSDDRYNVFFDVDGVDQITKKRILNPQLSRDSRPVKCYNFPFAAYSLIDDHDNFVKLAFGFENTFSQIYYLGPLREYPQRVYAWGQERPNDVGQRGEFAIHALLAASKAQPDMETWVASWLKKMGLIHSFRLHLLAEGATQYKVRIKRQAESKEVLITDMGFGISQILPVLVLCYYCPEGSTLILEQPEIHLHPSVQASLADVFIDAIQKRGIQIILESHSEHLLRRLQRRIAEAKIDVGNTSLNFCRMENEASTIEPLALDSTGNISNWPKDFFGDLRGDLIAVAEQTLRREMEQG